MTDADLARRRTEYETAGVDVAGVAGDPMTQWQRWYADVCEGGVVEPNVMILATVDADGHPDARAVLVRGADERSLVFHTNYASAKSRQLDAHPYAAGVFDWLELHRQCRVRGRVERLAAADSDAYFATRPRPAQIGAWASPQSDALVDRAELDRRVGEVERRFADSAQVPRPDFWGGWRLAVDVAEFWQGRPNRLHDRVRYRSAGVGESGTDWLVERLAP